MSESGRDFATGVLLPGLLLLHNSTQVKSHFLPVFLRLVVVAPNRPAPGEAAKPCGDTVPNSPVGDGEGMVRGGGGPAQQKEVQR